MTLAVFDNPRVHARPRWITLGVIAAGVVLTTVAATLSAGAAPIGVGQDGHGQQLATAHDPVIRLVPHAKSNGTRSLMITGRFSTSPEPAPATVAPSSTNDGAIPLARSLTLTKQRPAVTTSGRIGDGPQKAEGQRAVDYDFYRFQATVGSTFSANLDADKKLSRPSLLVYDARGTLLVGNALQLSFAVPRTGSYYVAVSGLGQGPADPFVASSGGPVTEGQPEGTYDLDVRLRPASRPNTDSYSIALDKGDVLGVTVRGSANRVAITEPDGGVAQSSMQDIGLLYPKSSPLPHGGNATADHIADQDGLYQVSISGEPGAYAAQVVARPAPSIVGAARQTIYLDFSGPTIDNRVFGAVAQHPGIRKVAPMRSFLPEWGMAKSSEKAVITATTQRVVEVLRDDLPGSKVRVVNSLESPDLFGQPGVSRIIIGGTSKGTGLFPAFGWAQSIDPGNFAREESAITMPELMSLPAGTPVSLNTYLTAKSDRVKAVAQALGNTSAHEAGHLLGNHHTYDLDKPTSVMNTGNLFHVFAVGRDAVAGTRDDVRLAFASGRYDPTQGLIGVEDTVTRSRYALAARSHD